MDISWRRGKRCRLHGGCSLTKADKERITKATGRQFQKTGPKSPQGRERSFRARDAGRDAYWARIRQFAD
jgi:hypothetical protein